MHENTRYYVMFTISNTSAKTPRDKFLFLIYKSSAFGRAFCFITVGADSISARFLSGAYGMLPYKYGGSICKNSAVLFTFWNFYGKIILNGYMLDKLEFDGGN